jgi:hypothetical protein
VILGVILLTALPFALVGINAYRDIHIHQ